MGEFFILSFFLGALFFLFPVFVYADGYFDVAENRLWFALRAYNLVKIIGGYAMLTREGIAVHVTKKKAIFLPYDKMADTRKKFEITDGFQLYRIHVNVETGGAESTAGIMIAAFLQSIGGVAAGLIKTKHPFISFKNGTLLGEKTVLKVSFQTAVIFNGLTLSIAITKKILEAIINWNRKRKLTASWKKRQSA